MTVMAVCIYASIASLCLGCECSFGLLAKGQKKDLVHQIECMSCKQAAIM